MISSVFLPVAFLFSLLSEKGENTTEMNDKNEIKDLIYRYTNSFERVLYEVDETFIKGMEKRNLAGDDIERYKFWEWTQGVGLYGFWKIYKSTGEEKYRKILLEYYDRQMKIGFPAKNVNTTAPLLAMSFLAEHEKRDDYMHVCEEWAKWIVNSFPLTKEGGFQHITSDTLNDQELWDDTLFMTVLFLANMGRILKRKDYQEEAEYQFLLHTKYLVDRNTGLWYHGWTFNGNNNFAGGLWGRGNCWITAAIPEFLSITDCNGSVRRFLVETLKQQVESLVYYQEESGMWHTLIDDRDSYVEASATCGFAYGILKGVHMGVLDQTYDEYAKRAFKPIQAFTDKEGILHQVSYGTPMGRKSKNFYKKIELKPMPYGQALAILFMMELLEDEK